MSQIEIHSNAAKVKKEIDASMKRALKIVGMMAESYAKAMCPVDTGLLRNSITFAIGGEMPHDVQYSDNERTKTGEYTEPAPQDDEHKITLYVGTNVHYAPYQELGHNTVNGRFVPPQSFLRPALENHIDEYKRVLQQEMK